MTPLMLTITWAVLIAVFVVIECFVTNLVSIWFAGGAIVALVASLLGVSVHMQVVLFLAVSLLLVFAVRPAARRTLDVKKQKTNLDAVVGADAVVISDIKDGRGMVKVLNKDWTAACEEDIPAGENVTVTALNGVTLTVKRKEK